MRHVVGIRFDDAPETLSRLVRIVSTNDYRLESLSVAEAPSGRYATIVVEADAAAGELLQKRLNRVVAVQTVRLYDTTSEERYGEVIELISRSTTTG